MKIELKWSLWTCTISSWEYSDWTQDVLVVSWNTYEEAKNAIKIYYQKEWKVTGWRDEWWLMFNDRERWVYKLDPEQDEEWDISCYSWEDVKIERLSVIYDWWEVANKSLIK